VTDVNGITKVQFLNQFIDISRARVHLIPAVGLRGPAMPATIMRNDPKSTFQKEHHLRIPIVS